MQSNDLVCIFIRIIFLFIIPIYFAAYERELCNLCDLTTHTYIHTNTYSCTCVRTIYFRLMLFLNKSDKQKQSSPRDNRSKNNFWVLQIEFTCVCVC